MTFTLIHTADLQFGRSFAGFPAEAAHALKEARLSVVDRLAAAAQARGAAHVLVAGDVFDGELLAPATLRQPLARMRSHAGLTWHLLPGNHDPHRAGGVWERLIADGLPSNVRPWLTPAPAEIATGVWLLPAPLHAKATSLDPTVSMDTAATPPGAIRIGLAHGSIRGFGGEGEAAVPIAPDRARRAGLTYFALGDWHGTVRINDRAWYSGTPEPDRFADNEAGNALSIRLSGASGLPEVERVSTAHYLWRTQTVPFEDVSAVAALEAQLAEGAVPLDRQLLRLKMAGTMGLVLHADISLALEKLGSALRFMAIDDSEVRITATPEDLDRLGRHRAIGSVARQLLAKSEDAQDPDRAAASDALQQLFAITSSVERAA